MCIRYKKKAVELYISIMLIECRTIIAKYIIKYGFLEENTKTF